MRALVGVLAVCAVLSALSARAEVVRVEVGQRADADAKSGYELIAGRMHFEIDPAHLRNRIIADVDLAPRNDAGRVAFSADFRILKPKTPAAANGAAWVEIPNRGGRAGLNRFITQHGFTVMQVGWEFDVPAQADKLRIQVPAARQRDGRPIRGLVQATFTPDKAGEQFTVSDLADYPPVKEANAPRRLIARRSIAFSAGEEVPLERWKLDGQRVTLAGGFEPGRTYEISYLAENPPVAGLGLAAIRDAVAWLKDDSRSLAPVRHAYAFGSSQCGRLLREYLYLGFNTDEHDRMVLDGLIANVAGAGRLIINARWATPRETATFHTASYPFADNALPDPIGQVTDGVQENPRAMHRPKVFYLNTASEYWGAGRVAGLSHTTPDGTRDVPLPENTRSYFFAGTQHGPGPFPPKGSSKDMPWANPVSASPVTTALRLAMHRWVVEGKLPPPSVYPKLSDGTLVPVLEVRFPALPGIPSPCSATGGPRIANPLWPNDAGVGKELPLLVPQVDADGNDLGGIRLPDISVPLGTYTGWVFRAKPVGDRREMVPLRGSWIPLAATAKQREAAGDPRLSAEERYASKDAFLARVDQAIQQLVERGYVLSDDVVSLRKLAEARWDHCCGAKK